MLYPILILQTVVSALKKKNYDLRVVNICNAHLILKLFQKFSSTVHFMTKTPNNGKQKKRINPDTCSYTEILTFNLISD